MRKRIAYVVVASVLLVGLARGQTTDAALKDRVNQLVERLGAPEPEKQKAAEEALVKLGAKALPLLPEKVEGAERSKRLEKIREMLREGAESMNLGASKVTLQAKAIRLSEVVQKLQTQTGNPITDLRETEGDSAGNPALDLDIVDKPFLEALDIVCKLAEVTPNFYTDDGTIGLMAGKPPEAYLLLYSGPFRIAFKQISILRDLQMKTSSANAQLEVAWEPRLRPMLMKLDAKELKVVDDQGKVIEGEVKEESTDVVLRPESPVIEVNLNLKAPERSAKTLASMKVKAVVTVPAGLKTFRFPSLAVTEPKTINQGSVSVILDNTEVDESTWKVNVLLSYPEGGDAFESYRQGLFNNRIWLHQKRDGSKFEHNGGFSNTSSDDGKLGFEYLFVDAPGKPSDYGLVYETPSKVLTIPLEFEFKDVPLP